MSPPPFPTMSPVFRMSFAYTQLLRKGFFVAVLFCCSIECYGFQSKPIKEQESPTVVKLAKALDISFQGAKKRAFADEQGAAEIFNKLPTAEERVALWEEFDKHQRKIGPAPTLKNAIQETDGPDELLVKAVIGSDGRDFLIKVKLEMKAGNLPALETLLKELQDRPALSQVINVKYEDKSIEAGIKIAIEKQLKKQSSEKPREPLPTDDPVLDTGYANASAALKKGNFAECVEFVDKSLSLAKEDRKIRLESELSRLLHLRAKSLARMGLDAAPDYRIVIKHSKKDPQVLNEAAWFFATSPVAEARDGKLAVDLAKQAIDLIQLDEDALFFRSPEVVLRDYNTTIFTDTLATAYAECGDFEEAVRLELEAIELRKSILVPLLETALQVQLISQGRKDLEQGQKDIDAIKESIKTWEANAIEYKKRLDLFRNRTPFREQTTQK